MDNDVEAIARRRVQARLGFLIHLAIYLATNGGLFALWLATGRGYPWFLWPTVCWGIGVVGHAMTLVFGPDSRTEQHAIEREVRRLRAAER